MEIWVVSGSNIECAFQISQGLIQARQNQCIIKLTGH